VIQCGSLCAGKLPTFVLESDIFCCEVFTTFLERAYTCTFKIFNTGLKRACINNVNLNSEKRRIIQNVNSNFEKLSDLT
jgi:hypothetical protein